jgi:hypothetical protein
MYCILFCTAWQLFKVFQRIIENFSQVWKCDFFTQRTSSVSNSKFLITELIMTTKVCR